MKFSHYKDLEQFTSQHGEFIAMVNHSFQRLKILYNVALPVAEIGYIHDILNYVLKILAGNPQRSPGELRRGWQAVSESIFDFPHIAAGGQRVVAKRWPAPGCKHPVRSCAAGRRNIRARWRAVRRFPPFHVNNLQFSLVTFDKADRAIIQRAGAAAAFNKINGVPVSVISKGPWKYSPLWMLAELIHRISNRIQMDS